MAEHQGGREGRMTKEQVYQEYLRPLVQKLYLIAKEHDIPCVLIFQGDDGEYFLSYYTPRDSADELHGLVKWVQEH